MPDQPQNFISCTNFSKKCSPRWPPALCVINQCRNRSTQTILAKCDRPDEVTMRRAHWSADCSRSLSVGRHSLKTTMRYCSQQHFTGNRNFLVGKCGYGMLGTKAGSVCCCYCVRTKFMCCEHQRCRQPP